MLYSVLGWLFLEPASVDREADPLLCEGPRCVGKMRRGSCFEMTGALGVLAYAGFPVSLVSLDALNARPSMNGVGLATLLSERGIVPARALLCGRRQMRYVGERG